MFGEGMRIVEKGDYCISYTRGELKSLSIYYDRVDRGGNTVIRAIHIHLDGLHFLRR